MFRFLIVFFFLLTSTHSWAQSRQEQRFQKPIQDLERSLKNKNPDRVLDLLIQNGNRSDLFELEALLRVYGSEYPETLAGFLEENIKPFEDELGKWLDVREAIAFSEKVGAPREVITYLQGKEESVREQLKEFLVEQNLVGKNTHSSPLSKLQEALEETEWSGKKKDRKLVLRTVRKLLKEVAESDYDMKLVEDGVHELRRDLRWIPIYLRSFPDLFKLDDREIPEAKINAKDSVAESPYSKIPRSRDPVSFPILFPKLGFLAINKVVQGLGQAKDIGRMELLLAHVLKQTGLVKTESQAKTLAKSLVKKHPDYVPVFQKASALYRDLVDEKKGLVTALRPLVKEQKDWSKQDCRAFLRVLKSPPKLTRRTMPLVLYDFSNS